MTEVRGRLYAAGPWTVETVQLECVPARHDAVLVGSYPDGPGAWLLVKTPGMVWWVRSPEELGPLGVPMADLKIVREW
jgi:hypothetical protein